ncbi:MAG: aminopeptidase P family protein [Solobacterium sp.]|nr:aminopeptidase P family protein [Solobacterium sp.]
MTPKERVALLRQYMKEEGIDIYYIPNEDDHLSEEYTADYFKCKSFISGFSGEAGCTIVSQDFAGLWTDGRYFTQAEQELAGTGVELMRMGQEGVLDPLAFLAANTPENGVLGYDGRVVSAASSRYLKEVLKKKNAKLSVHHDLAGKVWGEDRPAMPQEKIYTLAQKYTGESVKDKISRTRAKMQEKGADVLILTALEDPCWLLNIRGNDIVCTPVSYAFAMVSMDSVSYYIDSAKLTKKTVKHLQDNGVSIRAYEALAEDLAALHGKTVWAALRTLNTELYAALAEDNRILNEPSPLLLFRAVKNETEIRNIRNAHVKDGIAMVRFIKWVKETVGEKKMTEVTAQNYLYDLRAAQADYIEPSFPTISAYQANGAMMHYSATDENHAKVEPRGFLLVDSGGTYKDGTTDITRTISLGRLSKEEKMLYTKVLKGHMALGHARFLYGTCGNNLDILARGPLWDINIDYQCGTGHGVGHVLSVHEGPHGIRWGMGTPARPAVRLEPGMIVTNEPGVYMPHKLGIRIENELLVTRGEKNFYGQFLYFEDVTYCPYDLEAIDLKYLSDEEIGWLNDYHQNVYRILSPHLNKEEKKWLREATRKVKR